MFGFDGKFWRAMSFMGTMFLVNAMWLLGCLPIVTAGASTAAMLHTYLRLYDRRAEPLHRLFWKGFTSNLKQAAPVWAVYLMFILDIGLVLWTGWKLDKLRHWAQSKPLLALAVLLAAVFLFTIHYVFGIIAYLDCSFQQSFVNALGMSFRHIGWTALMILLSAAAAVTAYIAPFMTLIVFGAVGAVDAKILLRLFRRHTEPAEEAEETREG